MGEWTTETVIPATIPAVAVFLDGEIETEDQVMAWALQKHVVTTGEDSYGTNKRVVGMIAASETCELCICAELDNFLEYRYGRARM